MGGGGALRCGVRPLVMAILLSNVFGEYGAGFRGGVGLVPPGGFDI